MWTLRNVQGIRLAVRRALRHLRCYGSSQVGVLPN